MIGVLFVCVLSFSCLDGCPRASQVVLEQKWAAPKAHKVDWRKCQPPRRTELAREYAITAVESIERGKTLELGTVHTLMGELVERLGQPPGVLLVEPTISWLWARPDGEGADVPTQASAEEASRWAKNVENATHLFIVVQSETPAHYTLLEVRKTADGTSIEFRDALPQPPESAREAATRILRFLCFIGPDEHCPPRCNKMHQLDGWSCGIWVTRFRRKRKTQTRLYFLVFSLIFQGIKESNKKILENT